MDGSVITHAMTLLQPTDMLFITAGVLIGIIVGTYSSIAIAAPILLLGEKKKDSK